MITQEQWKELYAAYGRAILTTHMLEQRVVMIVALWRYLKSDRSDGTFTRNHDKLLKIPFGRLLLIGIKEGALSDEAIDTLNNYRKIRNLLVHDITASITLRLCTKDETKDVITELNDLADSFEGINGELSKDVFNMYIMAGGSEQEVLDKANNLIAEVSKLYKLQKPLETKKGPTRH